MNCESRFPMPLMKSVRIWVPILGGRLNLVRLQVDHFLHRIGQRADHGRFAFEQHLHHDDAGVDGLLGFRHFKTQAQVDHRHYVAAQIDHAAHEVGRAGNLGDRR